MTSLFGSLNVPSTTSGASQTGGLFGSQPTTSAPAASGLFGAIGSNSKTQNTGGLFGTAATQLQPTGGIFGGSGPTSQPHAGGLFGATTQPQQLQTGGILGGTGSAASQTQPGASLFEGATQPQQQQIGGLFSSLGTTTKPQIGGGLFGATTQPQQQQASGIFGGLGVTSQPQQQPEGGLFGATAQPQQQQQPGGLFGGLGASAQTQQTQQQASQQPGGTTDYFDSILEKTRKRGLGETGDEDLPQIQLGLGDLRQRIKRLNSGAKDKAADGRAHYLLAASGVDPGAAIRDLNTFNSTVGKIERPRTHETADTDVENYLLNLQTQTTLSMISDGLARSVRDFDSFLEENVSMEWDAQRKRIYQHFGIKHPDSADGTGAGTATLEGQGGFGQSRRSKAASLASSQSRASINAKASVFGRSSLQKSVIGAAVPGGSFQPVFSDVEKQIEANSISPPDPNDRSHREKQSRYAEMVGKLNLDRLEKRCLPLLHEFQKVAAEGREEHSHTLSQAYGALIEIIKEDPETRLHSDPLAVKERGFVQAYLDEAHNSAKKMEINRRILRGSTRYLEKVFLQDLESYIAKSPRDAVLGGRPGVIKKVQAYVRLRNARKDLTLDSAELQQLGEDCAWAVVYYLLRAGAVQEAVEYVEQNIVAFRSFDRNFQQYITNYARSNDKRLDRQLQERINSEYYQRLRVAPENSIDPFRMACYKVVGRCDLKNRSIDGLNNSMEDYFWIQFVLAREVRTSEEIASEVCNLATVQGVIKDIGERFFSKGENYGSYVFLQILGGHFEEAVAFLYPHAYPDAVHLAIALDYYGLLRVSDPELMGESNLLSFTTRSLPQIKFGHMLGLYTRDFRVANSSTAVEYLTLICLNKDLPGDLGKHQVSLCHEGLRELVLESREFAMMLGDIRSDGQRIRGVIEKRMKLIGLDETSDYMRVITIQAASIADDNGRTTDAVLLYHLAGDYDNVITIINRALSEALSVQIGQEPMRLQPLKPRLATQQQQDESPSLSLTSVDNPFILGQNFLRLYKQNNMYMQNISEANLADCEVLLKMGDARIYVHQEQWSSALDTLATCQILPIDARGNAAAIRSCATKFSALSQPVANVVPNLLMWAVVSCTRQIQSGAAVYGGNDGTHRQLVEQLRQMTMDLTVYTSQLRYRFPVELHEALAIAQAG